MTKDIKTLRQGAFAGITRQLAKIQSYMQAEDARRKFWQECVLASLSAGRGTLAIVDADTASEANIQRDEYCRELEYEQLALEVGLEPPTDLSPELFDELRKTYEKMHDVFLSDAVTEEIEVKE